MSGSGEEGDDPITRCLIQNLSIWGNDSTNPDGGINAQRTYQVKFHNCEIGRFAKSTAILLNLRNTFLAVVEQCSLHGGPGSSWLQAATGILFGCIDEGAGQGAWQGDSLHIKNSIFQYIAGKAIELDSGHASNLGGVSIRNSMFHHSKEGHIDITNPGGAGVRVSEVEIVSCAFETAGRLDETTMQLATSVYLEDVNTVLWGSNQVHSCNIGLHLKDVNRFTLLPSFHFTVNTFESFLGDQTVSSITRSGSTATVTTASAHGYTTGKLVAIKDADQTEYNGVFTITVTGASTFTYTVSGTPATPATGTILANASIAYRIDTPGTASRGTIGQSQVFQPEVGTTYSFDDNAVYISWMGMASFTANAEWTDIVQRHPAAFQGTWINRSAPAETGRPLSEHTRLYAFPDGSTQLRAMLTPNRVVFDSAAPTTGTWTKGDICFNTSPDDDTGPHSATTTEGVGWICTATGTPGTWRVWGDVGPSGISGVVTSVTAGTGLTGGGTGAVTLNVIGGDGITANADDIALSSTAGGAGLTYTTGVLAVGAGDGITVNANDVALASGSAGAGLTYTTGVLAVGAGDGITVNADDVALASGAAGTGLAYASGVLSVNTATGITTSGDNVIHATGDAGDLHTNYAEHDQTETISAVWTFSARPTFNRGVIINESGGSALADDFRVESDTNINMLFVDSSANAVGIGTNAPDADASLEIAGVKAVLLPRLTTTERNALTAANGMIIYNTTTSDIEGYTGGSWTAL
jgi:hypothetical protein